MPSPHHRALPKPPYRRRPLKQRGQATAGHASGQTAVPSAPTKDDARGHPRPSHLQVRAPLCTGTRPNLTALAINDTSKHSCIFLTFRVSRTRQTRPYRRAPRCTTLLTMAPFQNRPDGRRPLKTQAPRHVRTRKRPTPVEPSPPSQKHAHDATTRRKTRHVISKSGNLFGKGTRQTCPY